MTDTSNSGTERTVRTARRLAVAVCTGRSAGLVRPALESVAGQRDRLSRLVVVTSGLAGAELEAHRRQASELGAELVEEPAPGLSRARNRALRAVGDEPVIAFLDDDAIAAPDWAERLAAHWSNGSEDVGCIGGPVVARWQSPPPPWARAVPGSFSLLDFGPGVVELVPPDRELYGANISFAVDALRAVGGFDVARGAWGDVPLAGEETLAQRQLVARGWRVLYAGDVRVEHVIGGRRLTRWAMLRRRFYVGASGDETHGSPLGGVARLAKATAGAAAATARRDGLGASERAARMAQSAGVALGPIVRRRLRRRGWPGPSEPAPPGPTPAGSEGIDGSQGAEPR